MKTESYIISEIMYNVNNPGHLLDFDKEKSIFINNKGSKSEIPEIEIDLDFKASSDFRIYGKPGIANGMKTKTGYIINIPNEYGNIIDTIEFDEDMRNITVQLFTGINKNPFEGIVGEIIFRTTILPYKGILIHASAIEYSGMGIIFSAPSGTGKSTHANLWVRHLGAVILNGDRAALRTVNNEVNVYGTPWSGSSHLFLNKKAPLKAIVLLEQAPFNKIEELSRNRAVSLLAARCFLPYFDSELMELSICNLEEIIKRIPIYLLKCRPDYEAAETVMNYIH